MPLVSVILPTFNRAHILLRSINSVLNQSLNDLELIVVDDFSTDNTSDIIREVKDERVKVIFLKENKGACFARNAGIEKACGKYIAFQDSGDEWLYDKLITQVHILDNNPDYQATCASYLLIDEFGKSHIVPTFSTSLHHINTQDLLWGNLIGTPTLLMTSKLLQKIGGFDNNLPRFQDWELGIRIAQEAPILFTQTPLMIAHACANSISNNREAGNIARERIINKHFDLFIKNKKALIANLNGLSTNYFLQNDINNAIKITSKSLKYNPYSLKTFVFYIYLIAPISTDIKIRLFRNIIGQEKR